MGMKSRRPEPDPGLEAIANLERLIVQATDERMAFHNVDAAQAKVEHDAAVTLSASIAERMRAEYLARTRQS